MSVRGSSDQGPNRAVESRNGGSNSPQAGSISTDFAPQSLEFVERLYADYLRDPQSVDPGWRSYFDLNRGEGDARVVPSGPPVSRRSLFHRKAGDGARTVGSTPADEALLQERVDRLVHAYRVRGHFIARIDPLNRPRQQPAELTPEFHGLSKADFDRLLVASAARGKEPASLRQILRQMRNTYCRFIGVQFMHIDDLQVRKWLQVRMESTENRLTLGRDEQLRILTRLTDAVVFEEFLQKKYVGAKSFSLEGAESLIPLLDLLLEKAGDDGIEEIVLGMAHRGRLNVLANVIGKSPHAIFREFEDVDPERYSGRGDVKYHLGHSSDWKTSSGRTIHMSLCFNPSHLEFVNPVALGRMRAKQDRFCDVERKRGMALLIHGDAAFAGEGVVQETLNLSQLAGYSVGGTIHIIINNQLGFTTAPSEGRSCAYATDVAKMLQSPIFHVNGEDPEAVAQVVRLASDFRREFRRDVVIDMYCYRRRGHNEGDEPTFTQPVMYRAIEQTDSVREHYLDRLLLLGEVTVDEADRIADESRSRLEADLALARSREYIPRVEIPAGIWKGYAGGREREIAEVVTGVARPALEALAEGLTRVPDGFHLHPKLERVFRQRRDMAAGIRPLDWATAELLAFASLSVDGHRVRMSGQDSGRGTFSQRHAVIYDSVDGQSYVPLCHLDPRQAPVEIHNSPLSENGVLGFEYGYSLDCPDGLVLWEAQFGDFLNAAQVIVDQFIVSAENKWRRLSGLVLLLPHGLEGQGPEHSSARLERFLALAAEDNIQVVWPTTPAQYFHCLRRQVLKPWRKPLVVMTPKSLLRHAEAVSPLESLTHGSFERVLPDPRRASPGRTTSVLLCSGKVYYDLVERRDTLKRDDVAIVRIEQLYPVPFEPLERALAGFADGTPVCWVQEEPENMGAWRFLRIKLGEAIFGRYPLTAVCRPASASPAGGSTSSHKIEHERLLDEVFQHNRVSERSLERVTFHGVSEESA